jgi:hypothetical protein
VEELKLEGLDGSQLFGFLATFGLMRLLHKASLRDPDLQPRLYFDKADYCAVLRGVPSKEVLEEKLWNELMELKKRLSEYFSGLDFPGEFAEKDKQQQVGKIVNSDDEEILNDFAGLGCVLGGEAYESTLCAANGSGHQKLILAMRDVLGLLERHRDLLRKSLFCPWTYDFEVGSEDIDALNLGDRKPTLRLDPRDERLYALRFDDPVSGEAPYTTELGAQALAAAAFGGLPVAPLERQAITIGSERNRNKTYFYWGLWDVPASFLTVRSAIASGVRDQVKARARGFFAAFRAARVTGDKGKLSFAPTEPWW